MTKNDWIWVDDELPEIDEDVLCIDAELASHYNIGWTIGQSTRVGDWVNDEGMPINVTHWMRLPEPPEWKQKQKPSRTYKKHDFFDRVAELAKRNG